MFQPAGGMELMKFFRLGLMITSDHATIFCSRKYPFLKKWSKIASVPQKAVIPVEIGSGRVLWLHRLGQFAHLAVAVHN